MITHHRWNDESRAALLARYEAGETQKSLAAEAGVTSPRMHQLIFRAKRERLGLKGYYPCDLPYWERK
jgi:hypothetical protein